MLIPYSRSPNMEHVGRMMENDTKFGFTLDNCICLKVSRSLSKNIYCAYHEIIIVIEIMFTLWILSYNSKDLYILPYFAYMFIKIVTTITYDGKPFSTTL